MTNFSVICASLLVSQVSLAEPATEKYPIQKGDNLSSISKTFFGDSAYWPKIWETKKQRAPHLVEPGKSIHMFLGNEDEAPAFSIAESDDADELANAPLLAAADKKTSLVEIPPSKFPPKPVLKALPRSLPEWQKVRNRASNFKQYDVEILPRRGVNPEDRQVLPVYVQHDAVRPDGQYLRAAEDSTVAMDGDEVFVKMKKGVGQANTRYLLVHDGGSLQESPYRQIGNSDNAHVVEVLGEIELGGMVDSKYSSQWDYHRAKMIKALGLSLNESDIIPGRIQTVSMGSSGTPSGASAEIIGGNFDSKGLFFGTGSWVFLNRGSRDGLQPNQLLWVNTNLEAHGDDSPIFVGNTKAALVKIVRTDSGVSTALVVSSREALAQGDTAGTFSQAERPEAKGGGSSSGGGESDSLAPSLDDEGTGLDAGDNLEELN